MIQTDQTVCFDAAGIRIDCRGTGQDGDRRPGKPWPFPRFVRTGDLVEDRLTGLVWPNDAGLSEFPMTWQEGFEFVSDMNRSKRFGLANWRLPSREELFSLVSHQRINPAVVSPELFNHIFNGYYWTATPCAQWPGQAWYVHLGGGRVVKGMKDRSYMIWPVHGGSLSNVRLLPGTNPGAYERFHHEGNTVADRTTGLIWTRDADICREMVSWQTALNIIKNMNRDNQSGYRDWRLPTVRDLETLTDMTSYSPAIPCPECFVNIRPFYWSSTTSIYDPGYAWTLYTIDGNIGVGYKPAPEFHVWPVRGPSTP